MEPTTRKKTASPPARKAPRSAARKAPGPAPAARSAATDEREARIREAAYSLYLQRGHADGQALDDWLRAEQLVDETLASA